MKLTRFGFHVTKSMVDNTDALIITLLSRAPVGLLVFTILDAPLVSPLFYPDG